MICTRPHKPVRGADCFTFPDISGTGADVFIRGPSIAMRRWHGLGWMRCRARDVWQDIYHGTEGSAFEVPCVRYQDGRLTPEVHRYYPVPVGLEWEIVWPDRRSVPKCGYVDFDLQSSPGAVPHYQPRQSGPGICQPENVPGSYACYAPWSGRYLWPDGQEIVNFETGKLWHLYRSFVRTARGELAWCVQRIKDERLSVALPKAFIRSLGPRDYPLTLGPTFGNTSTPSTERYGNSLDYLLAANQSTASSGTITSVSVYMVGGKLTAGAYAGSWTGSNTLISACAEATGAGSAGWITSNANNQSATVSAGNNIPAFQWSSNTGSHFTDSGYPGGRTASGSSYSAGSLKNPWSGGTSSDWTNVGVYVTYTAGGGSSGFPFPLLFQHVHGSPFRR